MLERPEKTEEKVKMEKWAPVSLQLQQSGPERGLMERCNQSVSDAVTTRFFSAGIRAAHTSGQH